MFGESIITRRFCQEDYDAGRTDCARDSASSGELSTTILAVEAEAVSAVRFQGTISGDGYGYVYVMSYPGSDKVKIGHSLSPTVRAVDIGGTLAPETPVLEAYFWCSERREDVERKAHDIECTTRHNGEWFNISVERAMEVIRQAAHRAGVDIQLVYDRNEWEAKAAEKARKAAAERELEDAQRASEKARRELENLLSAEQRKIQRAKEDADAQIRRNERADRLILEIARETTRGRRRGQIVAVGLATLVVGGLFIGTGSDSARFPWIEWLVLAGSAGVLVMYLRWNDFMD